ncbi:Allantoate permease [Mycena kentingensis (nom. inval.)]|nr:Allantoate permease [Mycena kentingensis (nom. inval.)]
MRASPRGVSDIVGVRSESGRASASAMSNDHKYEDEQLEKSSGVASPPPGNVVKDGDAALKIIGSTRREITAEESAGVLRKIDRWVLSVMLLVYFLQQLDKSSLSYTSVFGIVQETNLVGTQYSWLSSIVYVAQLVWQPVSSYLLVRMPLSKYLFVHVVMWGVVVASMAAAHDFKGLITARAFLGLFEATVAPCFITITQMALVAQTGANDEARLLVGSLLSYGLGHIRGKLHSYQVIFLFIGLLTVVCSPVVYFILPDSPTKARFLNHEEKIIAIERLRANNQVIVTIAAAAISTKIKLKWPVIFGCTLPPIAGSAALMVLGRGRELRGKLLACYYILSFFTGLQPMLYSWASQNVSGHTKKTCTTGIIFVAQCAGNILGPLVYKTSEKPYYHSGLVCDLVCWIVLAVLTLVTAAYLMYLNKRHAARRAALGKVANIVDASLDTVEAANLRKLRDGEQAENLQAFDDLTDRANEDFVYVL